MYFTLYYNVYCIIYVYNVLKMYGDGFMNAEIC